MFLWPPSVDGVIEHRQQTTNGIIAPWILQFQETACLPVYEPDEYRLYPELPVLVKQKFDSGEWIYSAF
jgi:hypothetical protein